MAPRRGPTLNTSTGHDSLSPPSPQATQPPRSSSPSGGFTQFLSRPSKWFSRSVSAGKVSPGPSADPRPSLQSGGRKHKISRPTDPRPILENYAGAGTRSVLDLSVRPPAPAEPFPPSLPSSPTNRGAAGGGLGDLRNISKKGWSRSADDLSKISTGNLSPVKPSFQERIAEYRGRADSNGSVPSPPAPSSPVSAPALAAAGRHPFPSFGTSPPSSSSSSPPRSSTLPSLSISVSSPNMEESSSPRPSISPGQGHVHTRSHSFTPKLPSKLATPRYPASPQRGGSHDRETDIRDLDKPQGTPTKATFGFGFGGLSPRKTTPPPPTDNSLGVLSSSPGSANRQTTLLPPPTIIEPGQQLQLHDEPETVDRRASQIVFCRGFINRFADLPASFHQNPQQTNLQFSKGWKPFKLELKGSKLYFYKPPSDRAAGIKDLFPSSLVPPSEEEDEQEQHIAEASTSTSTSAEKWDGLSPRSRGTRQDSQSGTMGRKKRAYWGRRTHPDLIKDARTGLVEKGTFEALVHEAVFATTFFDVPESEEDEENERQRRKLRWHDFASSVLLSVPFIIPGGQPTFETEFLRCCSYLVSGADDDLREEEKIRVGWLANEYLRFHGRPVDSPGWEEWKKETIPEISLSAEASGLSSSGMTASSSMQAVFHPSPVVGSPPNKDSPNLNTFSPRPEIGKTVSLVDALFSRPPPPITPPQLQYSPQNSPQHHLHQQQYHQMQHQQQPGGRPGFGPPAMQNNRFPWLALQEEGLTRDVFLYLDPHLIARSLTLFHRSVLEQCPDNVSAEFVMDLTAQENQLQRDPSTHLFGSDDRPHWLTKLLLLQILGADTSSNANRYMPSSPANGLSSPGRQSEDRTGGAPAKGPAPGPQTSRTHSRSEVISVWTKVGELCRSSGDECSWKAIAAALCSRPLARLDKVWKRVDPMALAAVEGWATQVVSAPGDSAGSSTPLVEEGSLTKVTVSQPQLTPWGGDVKYRLNEELGKANGEVMIPMDPLSRTKHIFEGFRTSFELCPRKVVVGEGEIGDDLKRLVGFWKDMASEGGGRSGMALKFQRVEQFMSLSLAAEPRRKGLFEPYFWTRPASSTTAYSSLVPLLFPDPLPTLTLVDRSKLVRGRIDSDASEQQYLRSLDAQLRQEAGRIHSLDGDDQDFTKKLILGQGGTVISVYNGELLLVTQTGGFESTPPSRPESTATDNNGAEKQAISRNPSIRVKPTSSHGLDRKTSMARRSSLPSVSHLSRSNFVTAEPSSDPPLRVLVQAGTLNNLVNILVHGLDNISVSVADDNGEMTLREGMTRELVLDKVEFSRVWWNVFRSFVSPFVFFELLRKIYITLQPYGSSLTPTDQYNAFKKRAEVLATTKEWLTLGGGAQDILDDLQLFSVVSSFLDDPSDDEVPPSDFPPVQQAFQTLSDARKALRSTFASQMQRPIISRGLHNLRGPAGVRNARTRNMSTRDPPDIDRMDPEEFVDNLDGMATAAFSNVTQEDLYITADLLEVQSADRTGWFSPRDGVTNEELVEIQAIYSHLQEVEPSPLISELSQDSLYRLLPPGVRSCIRAYSLIRKWLISRLVAPRIGVRKRQARIELLIQVIELARLRNSETPTTAQVVEQPCVRSFVEAVTTSALLSIESRLHHRSWQSVALSRNCGCDSLSALLRRPFVHSTSSQDSLTIDVGWLLERMIEVIATPDILDATSPEGQQLVNFDKRRHLCNLISKASSIPSARKPTSDEANRRGFERLNIIEKEVLMIQFDLRGIKEESTREAANPGMNGAPTPKKFVRPFNKVVAIQIEKNRRDKNLRSRLLKEKQLEQHRNERRDDMLNKAMRPRKPASNPPKQHRNKKSMSVFLNLMRPISSAFGADIPQIVPKRSAAELDFPTTGKPTLVLSVLDAQIAQFINNERSYMFQLDTEDGGHYLLQAMNKREMTKWLETISRVTKVAANRRRTYLGSSPKPQIADHIQSHPIIPSRDPKAVFGVELEFMLRRETGCEDIPPNTVPLFMEQCLSEIESRGLNEVGIYRIAGAATEITALKEAYNRGEFPIRPTTDIHAICDLVKSWFRVLPEPLFPPESYHAVMDAMRQENLEDRLVNIRSIVQELPRANFDLLRRVSEHLDKVTDFEEQNHMTADALAIVFSPNLLRAPQNDFVMILNNMGLSHKLVKAFITHFHTIFDEADPEAELHSDDDDELESPILEEEEEEEDGEEEETHVIHDSMHDSSDDSQRLGMPFDNGIHYTPST